MTAADASTNSDARAGVQARIGGSTTDSSLDTPTISCQSVSRWFGLQVAVSDVSFEIGPGVTALLGPNGAGKSTLLRMLSGSLLPSRGQLRILGADPRSDSSVRSQIGLVPQQDALFDHMTAAEMLRSIATLTHLRDPKHHAAQALDQVQLDAKDKRPVSHYSKGMRQRVKLATALIREPKVLMADEPLAGLDPVQRRSMIALFRQLGDSGMTVLLSSHVLDEVSRFGSDIIVIHQGRLAATGDFHSLRRLLYDRPHRSAIETNQPRQLAAALVQIPGVLGVTLGEEDTTLTVDVNDPDAFGQALSPAARSAGATLRSVDQVDDDLESVFRYLVEKR